MHLRSKVFGKGFTLIELLVVIAIIGILSSVVLTNLNSSRAKARDSKRIADIQQIRLLLELYFDNNGEFPDTLGDLITASYTSVIPIDPSTGANYSYDNYSDSSAGARSASPNCAVATGTCLYYHLGAKLELTNNVLLEDSDIDGAPGVGPGPDGVSIANACGSSSGAGVTLATDLCYDFVPQ